jgi:CRISPR type I-E-associated protein CasB/Cse2
MALFDELAALDRRNLAALKRGKGHLWPDVPMTAGAVYWRITGDAELPEQVHRAHFAVAVLYALHPAQRPAASIGSAVKFVRYTDEEAYTKRIEPHFDAWLTSGEPCGRTLYELAVRLWQHGAEMDYSRLLRDLLALDDPERRDDALLRIAQRAWSDEEEDADA